VHIALPSIAAEFDLDAVSLSLVASSYLFATVIFLAFAALCTPGHLRLARPRQRAGLTGVTP
jgi:hypothetical protein